jgi:SSS family solute:Na+ symporter
VKIGALVFIIFLPLKYAIQLQLLGGIWMIQTFPPVVLGLYTRALNGWALLIGWACGMATGTWMAYTLSFAGAVYPVHVFGVTVPGYIALYSLIVNLVVAAVLSVAFNLVASDRHKDATLASDYV